MANEVQTLAATLRERDEARAVRDAALAEVERLRAEIGSLRKYNESQRKQLQDARALPRAERDTALAEVEKLRDGLMLMLDWGDGDETLDDRFDTFNEVRAFCRGLLAKGNADDGL